MLHKWTEILPLFIVRWLAKRYCEKVLVQREANPRMAAIARPDVLIVLSPKDFDELLHENFDDLMAAVDEDAAH